MSNETYREPVEDLAKKRQEYLKRKTWGIVRIIVTSIGGVAAVLAYLYPFWHFRNSPGWTWVHGASELMVWILLMVTGLSFQPAIRAVEDLQCLRYIPPISERIAALPPGEVLVRGSDQPTGAPEELLRAAQSGTMDPAGVLLRPNDIRSAQDQPVETIIELRTGL